MQTASPEDPLVLERFGAKVIRVVMLGSGVFVIAMPAYEFRHVLLQPSLVSAFFIAILIGAWSVGVPLLYAGIFGEELRWTFAGRELTLERSTLLRSRTQTLTARDIAATEVRAYEGDDETTYAVIVKTTDGELLETPRRQTRASAEELEADIKRRLGIG
jgi:hypothetical protein